MVATAVSTPQSIAAEPIQVEKPASKDVVIDNVADDKILNTIHSFTVTWKNPETGVVKTGSFTARRPSIGMLGTARVLKAKFNGGMVVDPNTDFVHEMLADLQVMLTDAPDWWAPADFFDPRPLREVWDHVRSWLDSFRNRRVG